MAAPAWSDVVRTSSASLVTPIVINMPTNLATGDRVVIFITMGRNRTQGLNWNNGTTGFVSALGGTTFNTAGNDHEHDVGYRDISGSPPSTISVTPSQSKAFIAWAGRIPSGTFDSGTAPEFTTTPNVADPANLDPSWTEDTLFIAGISADELTFITFPLADDQDSLEISNVSGAVCSIGQTGGGARNIAAWATTEANLKGVATVCIRAATAAATDLTVADAAQAQSVDNLTLTQVHSLAVADAVQAHTVDSLALTQLHQLAAQDAGQAQTADAPTLAVIHHLQVADATQAQSVDGPALTQAHSLTVDDVSQAQTVDNVELAHIHQLTVVDGTHSHTVDSLSLTQLHELAVADASQAATAEAVTLSVGGIDLLVSDVTQSQAVDAPSLTQAHNLTVVDVGQGQAADSPSLTQAHTLAVADATQGHTADVVTLHIPSTIPDPVAASFTESFGAIYRESPPREFRESA